MGSVLHSGELSFEPGDVLLELLGGIESAAESAPPAGQRRSFALQART
jgi:hypothetical protein